MPTSAQSGQPPFSFALRSDLRTLPPEVLDHEVNLHGGFAVDPRPEHGHIYFGMPGSGLVRVERDLRQQQLIPLPAELRPLNFHSTKMGVFDGRWRLFLPSNDGALVAIVDPDGNLDFLLPRPEFEAYAAAETPFKPTDTALVGASLYVADGYGANYISTADLSTRRWTGSFGGSTENPEENGKFRTAHGISLSPAGDQLVIADRPQARLQVHDFAGRFLASHHLPAGAWPCGIDFIRLGDRSYGVTGCLQGPMADRPAPIYILDGETYEVLSTIRPKEDLGVAAAQHLHNVIWHVHAGALYLLCQSWHPGYYFVLERA